jgi:Na+/H+ antiporter NhaC
MPTTLLSSFQNTSVPDINLERDLIAPQLEEEVLLGMETADINADKRFVVNISTILISALLFLMILAWFDFMQTTFFTWLSPENDKDFIPSSVKLWYAIGITIFILILITLIYYYSRNHIA